MFYQEVRRRGCVITEGIDMKLSTFSFHFIIVTCFSENIRLFFSFSLSFSLLLSSYVICVSWVWCNAVVVKLLWREWRRSIIMKSELHQQRACVCVSEKRASCEISLPNILPQSGVAVKTSWITVFINASLKIHVIFNLCILAGLLGSDLVH